MVLWCVPPLFILFQPLSASKYLESDWEQHSDTASYREMYPVLSDCPCTTTLTYTMQCKDRKSINFWHWCDTPWTPVNHLLKAKLLLTKAYHSTWTALYKHVFLLSQLNQAHEIHIASFLLEAKRCFCIHLLKQMMPHRCDIIKLLFHFGAF